MSKLITISIASFIVIVAAATLSGCPGKLAPTTPITSPITMSEIAEAVASGAVNSTYSSGSMARYIPKSPRAVALSKIIESYLNPIPKAEAALTTGLCPTLQSGQVGVLVANASCIVGNNSSGAVNSLETLTWAPCNMSLPLGTWSGGSNFSLVSTGSGTQMTCTGFPPFAAGDVVTRSFFSPTGRINNANIDSNNNPLNPLTGTILQEPFSPGPVTVLVDTVGATFIPNATNFTTYFAGGIPASYPTIGSNGYSELEPSVGETITFTSPVARQILVNGIHIKADIAGFIVWDFTVSSVYKGAGTFLTSGGANVTGTLFVQDNLHLVTTQSVFAGPVTYTGGCGVPNGGTVTTTFKAGPGTYPTPEVLTFPAGICGTGSINGGAPFYLFHSF